MCVNCARSGVPEVLDPEVVGRLSGAPYSLQVKTDVPVVTCGRVMIKEVIQTYQCVPRSMKHRCIVTVGVMMFMGVGLAQLFLRIFPHVLTVPEVYLT